MCESGTGALAERPAAAITALDLPASGTQGVRTSSENRSVWNYYCCARKEKNSVRVFKFCCCGTCACQLDLFIQVFSWNALNVHLFTDLVPVPQSKARFVSGWNEWAPSWGYIEVNQQLLRIDLPSKTPSGQTTPDNTAPVVLGAPELLR